MFHSTNIYFKIALDSDGDGFSNITEINARTFPGDPASKPATSDTTPPTVTAFTIPSTSSSLTVSITAFTATDNVAVTGYIVTESATAPAASATGWTATAPTSYTAATAGAKTLYAWAKDAAGNVSTSRSASVTVAAAVVIPGAATLVSPSGVITTNIPGYTWNAVSNSTWYYLWVNDSTGNKIQQWYTASAAGCASGTGTCSVTPTTVLAAGAGQWWIQTWNSSSTGPWSAPKSFTVQSAAAAGNVSSSPSAQVTGGGTPNDMTFWVGKWFRVTERDTGDSVGNTGLQNESGTYVGYLKLWGWDSVKNVLNADRYEQDATTGQWSSESLTLHYIGGSRLDFLFWSQIVDSQTNPTSAFSARISGSEQGGALTATFNTLGGFYQEVNERVIPSEYRAGNLTITGNLVPASEVPVPANILLH